MHKIYQVIILKEEFKAFVRTKPELASYVSSGKMTWQKFYELWSLYGDDDKIWKEYGEKQTVNSKNTSDNFNFSSFMDWIKNIDMDSVQKGINGMQKAVELLQGFTTGGTVSEASKSVNNYKPRQLFKKFED